DGDGDIDLAVTSFDSDDVAILPGNGDGTFAAALNYSAGDGPYTVTAGDFDGDGDIDLAVANQFSDDASILLGNGDGTFTASVEYQAGDGPFSVTSGDFDGDEDIDLVIANYSSCDVSILQGNGDGTFDDAVFFDARYSPVAVAVCDIFNDGLLDLVVANPYSDEVTVIFYNPAASATDGEIAFTPALALGQNYPNPFNPSTTILFSVPERARVTLDIFDVSGRRLARLIDSVHEAGSYSCEWNGRNEAGKTVSSGMYFYKLVTGERSLVKKMVLLR
ncbi:MAG: T9SS type A sorting domain-containing protein, partial [Candidatus Krumholzibacteria bacterium]|nr:T9SS type A sorting domain-containing protein [Candidatus Krumholzibacteria bacterium]